MSYVTTFMLLVDLVEEDEVENQIKAVFEPLRGIGKLDDADEWMGSKFPQVTLFGGAYNYMPLKETLEQLALLPYEHPESVQVFVNEEGAVNFAVGRLNLQKKGKWVWLTDVPRALA